MEVGRWADRFVWIWARLRIGGRGSVDFGSQLPLLAGGLHEGAEAATGPRGAGEGGQAAARRGEVEVGSGTKNWLRWPVVERRSARGGWSWRT